MSNDIIEIAIEKYRATRPNTFICPNAALADLSKSVLNGFGVFNIERKGYRVNEVISIYDDKTDLPYKWQSYSELDKITHDAVVSLYMDGNRVLSLDMLCRTITGKDNVSTDHKQAVKESLIKLMGTIIQIKGTYQGKEYTPFTGNLIYAKIVTVNINGQIIEDAIEILDRPVLYSYSQSRNQVLSYPVSLLSAGGKSSTRATITKHVMLGRIERIKNSRERIKNPKNRISDCITYDAIYDAAKARTKIEKQRVRNLIHKQLDDLIQQEYIIGYKIKSENYSRYHSIQILCKDTPLEMIPDSPKSDTIPPRSDTLAPTKTAPKQLTNKELQEMTKTL